MAREDSKDVSFEQRLKRVRDSALWNLGTAYQAEGTAITKILVMSDWPLAWTHTMGEVKSAVSGSHLCPGEQGEAHGGGGIRTNLEGIIGFQQARF